MDVLIVLSLALTLSLYYFHSPAVCGKKGNGVKERENSFLLRGRERERERERVKGKKKQYG